MYLIIFFHRVEFAYITKLSPSIQQEISIAQSFRNIKPTMLHYSLKRIAGDSCRGCHISIHIEQVVAS